jgi:hypothetical protein
MYAVDISSLVGSGSEPVASTEAGSDAVENEVEETTIKGKTTFRDLLEWGPTEAEIEEIIGMPLGKPTHALRDFFIEQGVEFSAFKDELQDLIDTKQHE